MEFLIYQKSLREDNSLIIKGIATTNALDRDGEAITITPGGLKRALPDFFQRGAPVKVEHNRTQEFGTDAVGQVLAFDYEPKEYDLDNPEPLKMRIWAVCRITDPRAIDKILRGELGAFSLGWSVIARPWKRDSQELHTAIRINELTVCRIPVNPETYFKVVQDQDLIQQYGFANRIGQEVEVNGEMAKVKSLYLGENNEKYYELTFEGQYQKSFGLFQEEELQPQTDIIRINKNDLFFDGEVWQGNITVLGNGEVRIEKARSSQVAISMKVERALKNKVKEFNQDNPENKITLIKLKKVYRRGVGAYNATKPKNIDRVQWAMGRVNTFLDKVSGKRVKESYKTDDDLLPKNHKDYSNKKAEEAKNEEVSYYSALMKIKSLENKTEKTYNNYPQSAVNNAKKVLEWKKKYGKQVKGGTIIGWTRANQIAKRENLSLDTIKRIAQFARHQKNSKTDPKFKDTPWKDRGRVAWLLWGGSSMVNWAKKISESSQA